MTDLRPIGRPVRWQDAIVTRREKRTGRISSFFIRPKEAFDFRPGQHVDIRLTAADGYRAIRSFSIASAPNESGEFELAIERLIDGEVSIFFHDMVMVGDTIEIKGPLGGHFIWTGLSNGPVLLVGGGSGLVPLMSMIKHRAQIGGHAVASLLLSARTWDDILFRDELLQLAEASDNFSVVFALTREKPRRIQDFDRRVDGPMMRAFINKFAAPVEQAFICGTNGFVNAAADGAVAAGVDPLKIRTERYGGP